MVMNNKAKEFYEIIENLVWQHDIDYMDAIIMHCEKNNIEVESIAPLVKANLNIKSKIQIEAEKLNYLPKMVRLDI